MTIETTFMQPQWTQGEGIAYECAHEAITDLMGIKIGQIDIEKKKETPDRKWGVALENEITRTTEGSWSSWSDNDDALYSPSTGSSGGSENP